MGSPITHFIPVVSAPQEFVSGYYTNGDSRLANLINHQYEWGDTLSWSKGHHQIKTGFNVIYSSSGGYGQEFGSGYLEGRFQINSRVSDDSDRHVADLQPFARASGIAQGSAADRQQLHTVVRRRNLQRERNAVRNVRSGQLVGASQPHLEPRPALRRTDLHQPVHHVLAARRIRLADSARTR